MDVSNRIKDVTLESESNFTETKPSVTYKFPSNTFYRSCEISLMEPVGSMSISPSNRDVVLAARKGIFIIDLEDPFAAPRFLAHSTTWEAVDIQWSPHPARSNWVASTSNQKLLIWNLDRPDDPNVTPLVIRNPLRISDRSSPLLCNQSESYSYNRVSIRQSIQNSHSFNAPKPPQSNQASVTSSNNFPIYSSNLTYTPQPHSSSIEHVLHAHTRAITDINWSPFHPEIVASSSIDTWIRVWDLRMNSSQDSKNSAQAYSAWNAAVTQVKFNRASEHRLASTCDNKVHIWDNRKGSLPLATIEAHQSKIYGIDWSRDTEVGSDKLVTCSLDKTVKFWNLGSESCQIAIGSRELVTESETCIQTKTPIWRARHLPFGEGVMTLPQRGDTSISMWSKNDSLKPMVTFQGHKDIVKEYVFRTKGGNDPTWDDRQFQLVTWSKDQTLKLWPVTEQQMLKVGHKPGHAIKVLMTRANAIDISYRDPSLFSINQETKNNHLRTQSDMTESSISVSNTIQKYLLIKKDSCSKFRHKDSYSSSLQSYQNNLPNRKGSPLIAFSSSFEGGSSSRLDGFHHSPSYGNLHPYLSSLNENQLKSSSQLTESRLRSNLFSHMARSLPKSSFKLYSISQPNSNFEEVNSQKSDSSSFKVPLNLRRGPKFSIQPSLIKKSNKPFKGKTKAEDQFKPKNIKRKMIDSAMRLDRGRMNGPVVDPIEWIANVKMEKETSQEYRSTDIEISSSEEFSTDDDTEQGITSQRLGEEIVAMNKKLPRIVFEKVELAKRLCVLTMYGPWADRETVFLRIQINFPNNYPKNPPKFQLEKSAGISLKTRAYLLRGLSKLSIKLASLEKPCIEICARFLIGEPIKSLEVETNHEDHQSIAKRSIESECEERFSQVRTNMATRKIGASFGANNQLVVFGYSLDLNGWTQQNPSSFSISRDTVIMKSSSSSSTVDVDVNAQDQGSQFLRSYTALSNAMVSLAKYSNTSSQGLGGTTAGYGIRDPDVVQLMSTDFFARRLLKKRDFFHIEYQVKPVLKSKVDNLDTTKLTDNCHLYSRTRVSTSETECGQTIDQHTNWSANTFHHSDLLLTSPAIVDRAHTPTPTIKTDSLVTIYQLYTG